MLELIKILLKLLNLLYGNDTRVEHFYQSFCIKGYNYMCILSTTINGILYTNFLKSLSVQLSCHYYMFSYLNYKWRPIRENVSDF